MAYEILCHIESLSLRLKKPAVPQRSRLNGSELLRCLPRAADVSPCLTRIACPNWSTTHFVKRTSRQREIHGKVKWSSKLRLSSWRRHQMGTFSTLLALCEGNPLVTGGFLSQRPVTWKFDVLFDLCLKRRLSKKDDWFQTPSCSLWRYCNELKLFCHPSGHDVNR